jgi:hypothetical protein
MLAKHAEMPKGPWSAYFYSVIGDCQDLYNTTAAGSGTDYLQCMNQSLCASSNVTNLLLRL